MDFSLKVSIEVEVEKLRKSEWIGHEQKELYSEIRIKTLFILFAMQPIMFLCDGRLRAPSTQGCFILCKMPDDNRGCL